MCIRVPCLPCRGAAVASYAQLRLTSSLQPCRCIASGSGGAAVPNHRQPQATCTADAGCHAELPQAGDRTGSGDWLGSTGIPTATATLLHPGDRTAGHRWPDVIFRYGGFRSKDLDAGSSGTGRQALAAPRMCLSAITAVPFTIQAGSLC